LDQLKADTQAVVAGLRNDLKTTQTQLDEVRKLTRETLERMYFYAGKAKDAEDRNVVLTARIRELEDELVRLRPTVEVSKPKEPVVPVAELRTPQTLPVKVLTKCANCPAQFERGHGYWGALCNDCRATVKPALEAKKAGKASSDAAPGGEKPAPKPKQAKPADKQPQAPAYTSTRGLVKCVSCSNNKVDFEKEGPRCRACREDMAPANPLPKRTGAIVAAYADKPACASCKHAQKCPYCKVPTGKPCEHLELGFICGLSKANACVPTVFGHLREPS
jgi:hypothetical protein